MPTISDRVAAWKSKDFSDQSMKPPATSKNSLNSRLDYIDNPKIRVKFDYS